MAEYKIHPEKEKAVLELFGLNKVAYKIYQDTQQKAEKTGLRIPAAVAINVALNQIYKPGIAANQKDGSIGETDMFGGNIPVSKLGTQVFSALKFTDTTDFFGGQNITMSPIDACLFVVNQQKNILKTSIQGRDGDVHEYIGKGDFTINIKGIIAGSNGIYPYNAVKELVAFLNQPKELKIEVPYLNDVWDIKLLVVESYSFPQNEGGYSYQAFELSCLSESEIALDLFNLTEGNETAEQIIALPRVIPKYL